MVVAPIVDERRRLERQPSYTSTMATELHLINGTPPGVPFAQGLLDADPRCRASPSELPQRGRRINDTTCSKCAHSTHEDI